MPRESARIPRCSRWSGASPRASTPPRRPPCAPPKRPSAYLARFVGDPQAEKEANIAAEIESAKAQAIVAELVLQATSELFDASGASAVGRGKQLDRHWRNARTAASHNPLIYKQRIVGDWEINGSEPPYVWQIGSGPATASR